MGVGDSGKGLYDHLYRRFFENRASQQGYDFQHAPGGSAPTPGRHVSGSSSMVDLGSVATAEDHLGGARPVPAGHSRYQEPATEVRRDREERHERTWHTREA